MKSSSWVKNTIWFKSGRATNGRRRRRVNLSNINTIRLLIKFGERWKDAFFFSWKKSKSVRIKGGGRGGVRRKDFHRIFLRVVFQLNSSRKNFRFTRLNESKSRVSKTASNLTVTTAKIIEIQKKKKIVLFSWNRKEDERKKERKEKKEGKRIRWGKTQVKYLINRILDWLAEG